MDKHRSKMTEGLWEKKLDFERFLYRLRKERLTAQISSLKKDINSLVSDTDSSVKGLEGVETFTRSGSFTMNNDFVVSYADGKISLHDLIFGINHQLKGCLSVIGSGAQYWLGNKKIPPDLKEYLEAVLRNIERIEKVLLQVSDFVKPFQLNQKEYDLYGILKEVTLLVRERARISNIEINLDLPEDASDSKVFIDKDLIIEAFLNIVINAFESMPKGGALRIKLDAVGPETRCRIHFIDQGSGISEENIREIFTPFFTTKQGCFGLGLPWTKRILKIHNGDISIKSIPGESTEVVTELPCSNKG